MGKSSKPTIGFWYRMTEHFGVCFGPVDGFYEIKGGDRTAWSGEVTANQDIRVSARDLYGGEKKEGGVEGVMSVYMGAADQEPPAKLVSLLGAPQPAYRGLLTLVFDGIVGAMNPYIKPLNFRVGRWVKGWRTPVWEPALCRIDKGMNPAHYIYRMFTDPVTGLGRDAGATLDLDRHREAAQILFNEGLGLVLKWTRRDVVGGLIDSICSHVGGEMSFDPRTGKQFLRLYRGGYDVMTLPLLDESNVIELTSHEQGTIYGAVNSITMTYHNCDTDQDESVTVTNPANIRAQGQTIDKPLNYPGLWNRSLGILAATRELHAVSSLPARGKMKVPSPLLAMVNGVLQEVDVLKGDVLAFSWKELNVVRLPIRILEIDRGTWTDNAIIVSYTTDVNAMPALSYIGDQPTLWVEPDTRPLPVPAQRLVEASYRDLASTLRDADLAALSADSGYVGALGTRPSGVAYNYTLSTRVGTSGAFAEQGSGDFTPTGLLPAIVPASVDPIVAVLTSTHDLDQVEVGTEALIDDEVLRVDAIDADTGAVTLARGCGDTLPAAHAANARVWFTDFFTGSDPTEYLAGETIQAKLLTRTGQGELDESQAPIASATLTRRQARPYPPADLKVGGQRTPGQVVGAIDLSWSHRNRKTQGDQLVDATQPSIAPEAGTTYTVRITLDGVQVANQAGIAGASWSTAFATNGVARVEVTSMRDGLSSWQTAVASFDYVSALAATGDAPDGLVGTPYNYAYTAVGGEPPYTWSIQSGSLPPGLALGSSDGTISGTPTDASQGAFVVAVTDVTGQPATLNDTITISQPSEEGDPYFAHVVSLLHFDGADGSDTFVDVIGANTWSRAGSVSISTAKTLVDGQVGAFNGSSFNYISTPYRSAFDFGTGDFTIEFTAMFSSVDSGIHILVSRQSDSPVGIAIQIRMSSSLKPEMVFRDANGGNVIGFGGVTTLAANVKYAFGVRRINGTVELYLNNALEVSGSFPYDLSNPQQNKGFVIGTGDGNNPGSGNTFGGWIDEFRVTKGVARDLTVPQAGPFPDHE